MRGGPETISTIPPACPSGFRLVAKGYPGGLNFRCREPQTFLIVHHYRTVMAWDCELLTQAALNQCWPGIPGVWNQ